MATILKEGQELRRIIKVYGVESPVIVNITSDGVMFKAKGAKVGIGALWSDVVKACTTPDNVPSKLYGDPMAVLNDSAKRITASLIKRLEREAKTKGAQ